MLQLLLYVNLVASKYILIENIDVGYNSQQQINQIKIAAIFETSFQSGYLAFYGKIQNYQDMNNLTCQILHAKSMNVIFENQVELIIQDEYLFKLNRELKKNTLYYISIISNNNSRNFEEIIFIKTISTVGLILDYYAGLGSKHYQKQLNLFSKNIQGLLFNIEESLNFYNYETKTHNALKLQFYSPFSDYGIKIEININQQVNLKQCWSNLSHYSCIEQPNSLQFTISQSIQKESLIEVLFEFSSDLDNKIQEIQVHYSEQYFKITPDQLLEQKFLNVPKQFYRTKYRLLQGFHEFVSQNFSINEQLIYQLNFEGKQQDQCFKADKADDGTQTECSKFFSHYNALNQTLDISEVQLNSSNKNYLDFSDQILFSKDAFENVNLNLTDATQGQIMWYEVTNNSTQSTTTPSIVVQNQLQNYTSQALQQFVNINQIVSWNGSFLMQNISGLYQSSYLIDGLILLNYSNSSFESCLALGASVIGNFSKITSICNANNISYVLFSNISQTNYSKLININSNYSNYTMKKYNNKQNYQFDQLENNTKRKFESQNNESILFTHIKQIFQIQNYIFVLGRTSNESIFSIYVFNLTDEFFFQEINRIVCYNNAFDQSNGSFYLLSNITDFNMTILQNKSINFNNTYSARGVIFYICENPNELRYRGFDFVNTTQLIMYRISPRFDDQITCCLQNNSITLLQVFIYTVKFDQLILFVTSNTSYSLAYMMSFTPLIDQNEILQIEMPIAIIPPYYPFIQSEKAVMNHDFLVLVFKDPEHTGNYSLAIYDLKKAFNTQSNKSSSFNNYWLNFTYMIAGTQNLSFQNQSIEQLAIVNQSLSKGSIIMGIVKDNEKGNSSAFTFIFYQNLSLEICLNFDSDESYFLVGHNAFTKSSLSQLPIKGPRQLKVYIIILSCSLLILIILCGFLVIQFKKKVLEIESKFEQLNADKEIEMK